MWKRWLSVGVGALLVMAGLVIWRVRKIRALYPDVGSAAPAVASARQPQKLEVSEVVYDGKLGRGWDDWGWGSHELGKGPARIDFSGYGGILFHHSQLPSRYGAVSFRYKANKDWGEFLHVTLLWSGAAESAFPVVQVEPRHVAALDGYREVLIDWRELNPERRPFDRVRIGARKLVSSQPVELDAVVLTKGVESADAAPKKQELRVLCGGATRRIDPLIYGSSTSAWDSGQSAKRIGGNMLSRLNWDQGFGNRTKDWFFENYADQRNTFQWLDDEAKEKRPLAMVVPMLGWVAKDGQAVGFPRDKFAPQQKYDPYKSHAGNGFGVDGKALPSGDPSLTSVPAPPELIEQWVRKLVAQNQARGWRGVSMYILDNETALWDVTHRDVHPKPVGYDELLERTVKYAGAIRRADPQAVIAGPAEWGWPNYFTSALDRDSKAKEDRAAHGGAPLVPWYLKELAAHEAKTGERLLDVLDLHFYPAQAGVFADNGAAKDAVTAELRLRSTRALWDPTYVDESWIGEAVRLIPRMRDWVKENYPGTKLSIGEWSFGAEDHISGGLATAEALGRFGQQGLDSAFHWGELKQGTPAFWAYRAFRDYDGKGARFQDVSLTVNEGPSVSLFASRDPDGKKLVLVLINRSAESAVDAVVALDGCGKPSASRLFSYTEQSAALLEQKGKLRAGASTSTVDASLEPFSLSVVELELGSEKR